MTETRAHLRDVYAGRRRPHESSRSIYSRASIAIFDHSRDNDDQSRDLSVPAKLCTIVETEKLKRPMKHCYFNLVN